MKKTISISICIITKNECDMLKQCLSHLKPYVDAGHHEIVVVDTGSTDNTIEMCKVFTDKIYTFEWINDFSAARNFAACKASNDWILCIDSDEYVSEWNENEIQNALNSSNNFLGTISIINSCGFGKGAYQEKSILYRFYNRTYYHFEHTVHEQLISLIPNAKETTLSIGITIIHKSYSGTKETLLSKAQRNINLLKKELERNPNNAFTLFNLGQSYYMIEDFSQALHFYSKGLEQDVPPELPWVKNMVTSYGYCLLNLGRTEQALELEGLIDTYKDYADYIFLLGYIYMRNGFFDDAIYFFDLATTKTDYTVIGSNSFRAYYNIGVIYECAGMLNEAKEFYLKCGDFNAAKERLNSLHLTQ